MTVLRGTRIELRPLRRDDAPALGAILRDRQVTRLLPPRVRSSTGREWVDRILREQRSGGGSPFAIRPLGTDEVVGQIRLFDHSRTERKAEVGYWIRRRCWGRGYGTEALRLIAAFGFQRLRLHRIEASVVVGNLGSRAVLERAGFRFEGTRRQAARLAGGWADTWAFGLLRDERIARAPMRPSTITRRRGAPPVSPGPVDRGRPRRPSR